MAAGPASPFGPPAWAMSGRPPPPLPPSATEPARTRSTALIPSDEIRRDGDDERCLAVGVGGERDDAGTQLLLNGVGQPLQLAHWHTVDDTAGEADTGNVAHLGIAGTAGQLAAHLGQFPLQATTLLDQSGETLWEIRGAGLDLLRRFAQ